jgi:D-serine deaminase-like pyridoxal phosphate-dependent protein
VTLAVDSIATVDAAVDGGVREVCIDVQVGQRRCGVVPSDAAPLAEYARSRGLEVRGVMGYEGHLMMLADLNERRRQVEECMTILLKASAEVGGDLVTSGGTGTYDINVWSGEIQAGSYCLMDTAYTKAGAPFHQSLSVLATVINTNYPGRYVANAGLKSASADHGWPSIPGAEVVSFADEHVVFEAPEGAFTLGQAIRMHPSHIDPTVALHERMHLVDGDDVLEEWAIDLRGW